MDTVVVREITEAEREYWDRHMQEYAHVHPLNAYDWGGVRETDGWKAIHLIALGSEGFRGGLLILIKKLPLLPFSIMYGPKGPVCRTDDREAIQALHCRVAELARTHKSIFIRIDPNILEAESEAFEAIASQLGYIHLPQRWSFWNSPRDVYRIDLVPFDSPEALLNSLDRDTRRCIRKAAKEGVVLEPAADEGGLLAFYEIFRRFSVGKGFMARGYQYQKKLWDSYLASGRGRLLLASYHGNVIGGLVCIMFGKKCVAMHMGTPYRYQKLQSYYAYVWESIRWAKEQGCVWYSFRGVGTTPTQEAFKRKFGPTVIALTGYYDRPFIRSIYRLFYWCEFTVLPAVWPLIVKIRKLLYFGQHERTNQGS